MKKFLSLALVLILVLATLASCNFGKKSEETTTQAPEKEETPTPTYDIDKAAAFFDNLYKEDFAANTVTAADFTVVAQVKVNDVIYPVEWTVDTDKVTVSEAQNGFITINVDEESKEEVAYKLTATIKSGDGKTATRTYSFTVPKYTLWSHDEYMNATSGETVVVKGIVVAMNSASAGNKRNHLFLADIKTDGGYYSYEMTVDPLELGIEIGMTVEVSGPATPYSKDGVTMQEIKGGSARIIDKNKQTVAPLDVTAKFAAGESLVQYVGRPVTIKGVEIGEQVLGGSSDYLYFKLGDKSSYLRSYLTDLNYSMLNKDGSTVTSAAKTQIEAEHAEHFGYTADVTGIVIYYGAQIYLMPISADCFVYGQKIEKTPDQKIADALDMVTFDQLIISNTVIDLPATITAYPEVLLSWASNSEYAVVADGKLTVTIPTGGAEIVITVTATCEGMTAPASKEFKVTLKVADPDTFLTLPQADSLGILMGHNTYTEGKYFVTGTIISIDPDKNDATKLNSYGNMTIQDADGNTLYIYGLYSFDGSVRFDKMNPQPKVGDTVTVYGILGQYNGKAQMKNGWLIAAPAADTELSIPSATIIGLGQGHNKYTADKYIITGTIESIDPDKNDATKLNAYGNMTIKDADGNTFYLYGLYTADGSVRFDKMEAQPQVGDTITVYGILGQYNGKAQMKNAWLYVAPEGGDNTDTPEGGDNTDTPEGGENGDTPTTPEIPATLAEQIAEAQALANGAYLSYESTMTGTVVGAPQESTYTAGTWKLNLTDGTNTITLYYVPVTGTPTEGCTITVTGKLTAYNGSAQFDKTATATVEGSDNTDTPEGGDSTDTPSDATSLYSYTFEEKVFSANETKELNGLNWTLAGEGGDYWGYDSQYGKGQQFGKKAAPYSNMTFTSAAVTGVTKIVLNTSGASGIEATLTVTVGGTQIGETITLTTTATEYTFESATELSGEIVFNYTATVGKAIYIKSIVINPAA